MLFGINNDLTYLSVLGQRLQQDNGLARREITDRLRPQRNNKEFARSDAVLIDELFQS